MFKNTNDVYDTDMIDILLYQTPLTLIPTCIYAQSWWPSVFGTESLVQHIYAV